MKAVVTEEFGAAPVVTELPDREAGQGEILVRVRASSLNGFDVAVASGMAKGWMEHHFPVVLGRDFAGTVVGDGGGRFAAGDEVFGVVAKTELGLDGGFAELVAVPEAMGVARVPAGIDLATAGTLGVAGLAAIASVEAIEPSEGQSVLVSGATGGVGSFAVQLLAARGVRVIATAKPGAPADFVRGLGASDVVDYTTDLASQVRAIAPGGVDAVLHLAGDPQALADLVAAGGRLASTGGAGPDQFEGRDITATAVMGMPSEDALHALASLVADGSLRPAVSRTYQLDDVPLAFSQFTGLLGKAAVSVA
ncbi:MAG: NADP-dependent oxidoreductase [Actinobacteria bacterium]|nr:NADP-dependent oxidoreductase [Actinomycetota bacterium]